MTVPPERTNSSGAGGNEPGDANKPHSALALSVIVPTRNEAPNVEPLTSRLGGALDGTPGGWELVFVDDSDDSTPQLIRRLADEGWPVRLLHREKGARPGGLGGAVQEGFGLATGTVAVVMDADLQHPPEVVPALVSPVLSGEAALVAGSRYGWAGGDAGLSGPWRHLVSRACRGLVHLVVPPSRPLQDPLSGLFALRRSTLDGVRLHPSGYKILLEVVVRARPSSVRNVGFDFAPRNAGRSKASFREGLVFLSHLCRLVVASQYRRQGPTPGSEAVGPAAPASPDGTGTGRSTTSSSSSNSTSGASGNDMGTGTDLSTGNEPQHRQ
ncbi:MAG TPA: polyprenol monophosphomannose synthase [Acidimicrobiales bacterium]|nr:polyprenol monophosphomannose synthase [Acidimicrobiales bacterium]